MREPLANQPGPHYERPNQPWVCGLAATGQHCPAGPTARGHCPALAECRPVRDGDRWRCNRSPLRGDTCDEGPTPEGACRQVHVCRPVCNLRTMRGRFVIAAALFIAGAMLILLSSNRRNDFIAPGPLAQSHAQLLSRDDGAQCSACHAAADDGAFAWVARIFALRDIEPTQSQLCLKCHADTISPGLALVAHNVSPEILRHLTAARIDEHRGRLTRAVHNARSPGEQLACSTCHREHHGPRANLTAIDNAACQACHQQRFESFAFDHPDFGIWPYERRTRIAFNHASHQSKHFAEKGQAFDCARCHVSDATRTVQLTASYETTCAECHDEKIATSVARGLPMFVVPSLDVDALLEVGHDIGPWPEEASSDFDGRLPPAMRLLLAADARATAAMKKLGHDFDFFEVDIEDSAQLAASADLAIATRALLADMMERGPAAIGERLSMALDHEVSHSLLAALVSGMSAETLGGAAADWLKIGTVPPNPADWFSSAHEVAPHSTTTSKTPLAFAPGGTWFRDEATLSIRYRPAAHADPVLTGWLELPAKARLNEGKHRKLTESVFNELADPSAPGLCTSCHSVEQLADGSIAVNWRAANRANAPRPFTKFSHAPHLALPQLVDCTTCHAVDPAAHAASYVGADPHRFISDFLPMKKSLCADCHTQYAAGDQCQSCHHYHVGAPSDDMSIFLSPLVETATR